MPFAAAYRICKRTVSLLSTYISKKKKKRKEKKKKKDFEEILFTSIKQARYAQFPERSTKLPYLRDAERYPYRKDTSRKHFAAAFRNAKEEY
jgi:hypothetical protein